MTENETALQSQHREMQQGNTLQIKEINTAGVEKKAHRKNKNASCDSSVMDTFFCVLDRTTVGSHPSKNIGSKFGCSVAILHF